MKRRDANLVLVALAALGGGIVAYSFPADLLELGIVKSRLADVMPTAAPPLGDTARALFMAAGGMGAALLTAALLPWKKRPRKDPEEWEAGNMTFAFSKLAGLLRSGRRREPEMPPEFEVVEMPADAIPVLRRADAHPDAPPRPPLFASRDLGDDALPPVNLNDNALPVMRPVDQPHEPIAHDITGLAMPRAPEPLPWETIQQEMDRLLAGVRFQPVEDIRPTDNANGNEAAARSVDPSLQELIERLERGLERRRAQDGRHPEGGGHSSPQPSVMAAPEEPPLSAVDDAVAPFEAEPADRDPEGSDLGDALAALRGITVRVG